MSREQFDKVLRLDEARGARLAEERAELARAKEEIDLRREEIAAEAAREESARWEVEAQRVVRDVEKLKKEAAVKEANAEKAHRAELAKLQSSSASMRTLVQIEAAIVDGCSGAWSAG